MSLTAHLEAEREQRVSERMGRVAKAVRPCLFQEEGSLIRMIGIKLEAVGCQAPIGSRCKIITEEGASMEAEVVGFSDGSLFLMPEGNLRGVRLGARVVPLQTGGVVAVGDNLLGRVIDGAGKPIDGGAPISCLHHIPLRGTPINPLDRTPITEPLDVGVRAINALLSVGKGQRMGLFAGSGVGKSTLLGMMTRHTEAEVIVVSLVGERGREVREFVDEILGETALSKAIVVATPADDSPLMRVHGAWRATAIAEYFSQRGKSVLLLMDSLTRVPKVEDNPAALLACSWLATGKGRGLKDLVVIPYKDRLLLFSRYLQQLIMESLGKQRDLNGEPVHQGLSVFGNKGSTDQHAYVQQLRDGLDNFFACFIEVIEDFESALSQHQFCEHGRFEVEPGKTAGDFLMGFLLGTRRALSETGRENITITVQRLDEYSLGLLIALFERAVGFYALLVNINAYNQPGVEAGKKAAEETLRLKEKALAFFRTLPGDASLSEVAEALDSTQHNDLYSIIRRMVAQGQLEIAKASQHPLEDRFRLVSSDVV